MEKYKVPEKFRILCKTIAMTMVRNDIKKSKGLKEKPKVLLFCDNPACFASHLAKKHKGVSA